MHLLLCSNIYSHNQTFKIQHFKNSDKTSIINNSHDVDYNIDLAKPSILKINKILIKPRARIIELYHD